MLSHRQRVLLFAIAMVGAAVHVHGAERPAKPNVVLILADDLGWQDVGCYDIDEPTPFETPCIDRLASQGVRFSQGYSPAPTCAPSRAAILSGRHPARTQKTHVVGGVPPHPYNKNAKLMAPWYSGRMRLGEVTIAEALQSSGYRTGQSGKWHLAKNHKAFPTPLDQGFDFSRMNLGVSRKMHPHRLTGFATRAEIDKFRVDENGFPFNLNFADARDFLESSNAEPFFLYHCSWLVHTPVQSRSERLLRKYCEKMQVPFPTDPKGWPVEGQRNPYYGAMVEMLDYYVGQLLTYLDETEDPRWPGHMLAENTYVIFTSDNGGMERVPGEEITDNYPLDKGKINAKEGGVRVPLIVRGPGVPAGAKTRAMANGLDFYPTILSWTGTEPPEGHRLDGADLAPFLASDLTDDSLIVDPAGGPRDTMWWHFPHSRMQSTIRVGGYKLIRNWTDYLIGGDNPLELYQLYDAGDARGDIEESKNLAASMPEKAAELEALLEERLAETKASPPLLNPNTRVGLPNDDHVPRVSEAGREGDRVWAAYDERGAALARANLIYTDNGGERYEEWYRLPAEIVDGRVEATLPAGTTHYVFNLIDENHFLVSHPRQPARPEAKGRPRSTWSLKRP